MSVEYFFFLLKICLSVRGLRLIQGRYTQTIGKRKKNGQLQHLGTFRQAEKKTLPESTKSCVCKLDF